MDSIDGIEIFPIISLVIFFLFFALLSWRVAVMKKDHIANMSQKPLE